MNSNTLVILAAGMGSRFGGLKQIEPIDDDGNFILHYSAYDAYRAGFKKIVFVIKEEALDLFKEKVGSKIEKFMDVKYAFQKMDNIPCDFDYSNRVAPWGTAHAIYCAKDYVDGSFTFINADDFYGKESFKLAFKGLKHADATEEATCIAYPFKNSVWGNEKVKRAVLEEQNGYIVNLIESSIEVFSDYVEATPLDSSIEPFKIKLEQLVSMNMFSLPHKAFDIIYKDMVDYFNQDKDNILKGEIMIPLVLKKAITNGELKLIKDGTNEEWMGMTYREDLDKIKNKIRQYKEDGLYPEHLFEE